MRAEILISRNKTASAAARSLHFADFCNKIGPSAKYLAQAKKGLVTGVNRTRSTHIQFFAFWPISDIVLTIDRADI
jgi:hypothetical protein